MLIAAAAAAVLWLVWIFVLPWGTAMHKRRIMLRNGIPSPPEGSWTPLGHIGEVMKQPGRSFLAATRWMRKYGTVYQLRFMFTPVVVVTDPILFSKVLTGPARLPKWRRAYVGLEMMTDPPHPNLVTSDKETAHWRSVRKAVAPAFNMATLKLSFPAILSVTERLISHLYKVPKNQPIDMDKTAQRLTVDVIGIVGFSKDFACTDLSTEPTELHAIQHVLQALQARSNPLNRWLPWRHAFRQFHKWRRVLNDQAEQMVKHVKSASQADHTLSAHLLRCISQQTGAPLDHTQLKSELAILWGAGFETSSHTIVWALLCIATHAEAEARVVEELRSLGLLATPEHPQPRRLQWEDLSQLKYLNAVLSESMRMFPAVASGALRMTDRPYELGPYIIPKGVVIWIPAFATQRSELNWEEPNSFRPERWLEGGEAAGAAVEAPAWAQAALPPAATGPARPQRSAASLSGGPEGSGYSASGKLLKPFLPFSEGPRNCVGQSLALVEIRAALALLLGHFAFELTPDMGGLQGVSDDARQAVTLRPESGLWMTLKPRKETQLVP